MTTQFFRTVRISIAGFLLAAVFTACTPGSVTAQPTATPTTPPTPTATPRPPSVTEFALAKADSQPSFIVTGPDGNLWFTEFAGNQIGRITPMGVLTEYPVPTSDSRPVGLAVGSDNNLWFTEQQGNKIGRITPNGTITEFPVKTAAATPDYILSGPDGNLWFTELDALISIPLCILIALLHLRLWDVDIIVNRALVYSVLTGCIAVIYLTSIILLQLALTGLAGGSQVALAGSTLGVALLFQPLRQRIQRTVDQRLYHRKYANMQTVAAFVQTLEHQTDLDQLERQLLGVVEKTTQPGALALWLRENADVTAPPINS